MTRCAALVALILAFSLSSTALAGPGSGSAAISPSGDVQPAQSGTWSIVYTATEQFADGTVVVTVPAGWTAPQAGSPASAGYVTVETDAPTGNPVIAINGRDIEVTADTLDAGLTLTIHYGDTSGGANPGAVATAPTGVGSYEFTVSSHPGGGTPVAIGTSPALDVTAGAPAQLEFLPDTPTVIAGESQPFTIVVLDAFGNRAPVAQTRSISLSAASGSFTPSPPVSIPAGGDSVNVTYSGTTASGGSPHWLFAFTGDALSPALVGQGYVNVTPAAVDPATSTITATGPVPADGDSLSSIKVISRDEYGNPRAGDAVDLALVSGTATLTEPPSTTDANGEYFGVASSTTAGAVEVSATVGGQLLSSTATIQFTAGPPNAGTSTVDAVPGTLDVGGVSTVTVTVRDTTGNPVPGASVSLDVSPPGGGLTVGQPGGVTGANGQITGTISSTTTGDRTVTATVNGGVVVTDQATVTFTPGPLADLDIAVTDASGVAGSYSAFFTLTARDARGNVVTDYLGTVDLSSTSGEPTIDWGAPGGTFGSINNVGGDTGSFTFAAADSGSAVLSVRSDAAGSFRVDAADGTVTAQSGEIVFTHAAAADIAIIAGTPQTATVGTAVGTAPTVRVTDAFGNPVDGATVTFGVRTAGSSVEVTSGGAVDDSTGTTDINGEIDCDVWTLAQTAGTNTLRAYIGGGSPSVDFTATGEPGAGASLVITPNGAQNATVGSTTNNLVTLELRDQYNNPVEGERVDVFISDAADGSLVSSGFPTNPLGAGARWGNTDANGQISVLYKAPAGAGLTDVIDGSASQVSASAVTDLVYTTVTDGATALRITFTGGSTRPAGQSFEFLVEAVDGNGNVDTGDNSVVTLTPEAGSGIQFSETDFGATVTQVTLSGGAATVYGRGTIAGTWDITVDDGAGGLTADTEPVTIEDAGVIAFYTVSTVDSVVAGQSFNVSIQARDQYGNLVDGATNTVNLAAVLDSDPNTLADTTLSVTQTTLVAGQANLGETYTRAETIQVRVRDASNEEGFSGAVKVKPAVADRIFVISGDGASVAAGATQDLTAEVRDPYGNSVSGEPVTFAVTGGGGSITTPQPVVTGADGRATATLETGATAGTNTVAATILGGVPPDERVVFTVEGTAGGISYYEVTPATTTMQAGTPIAVDVVAKDANDNTVTGDNSTVVELSSDGGMQFTAASGILSAGTFSTTMFDNVAETVTVTAQSQGGGPSGSSELITVNPGPAYELFKVSGDTTGIPVESSRPLVVEVRDQYGNPVGAGTSITFQVTSAPGPAGFLDSVGDPNDGITTTGVSGRGTVDLLTASAAGTHTVKATILDGNPASLETKTFTVSTVATGIAYYTVELSETQITAGDVIDVTVSAFDAQDNLVVDDNTTSVVLAYSGTGTANFGSGSGTLSSGVFQTTAAPEIAESATIAAFTSGDPATNGISPTLTVAPGPPAAVDATAAPATITANGVTTSTITSEEVLDQYGNRVAAGEMFTITQANGLVTIVSDDQDPGTSGLQRSVGPDGTFFVSVRSGTAAGPESIGFQSVSSGVSGAAALTLAPEPAFSTPAPPTPGVVYVGDPVQFSVDVTNTSATAVTLNSASRITFTDGTHTYAANLLASTPVAGGATGTLTFASAVVDVNQSPTYYAPAVELRGTDQYGTSFFKTSQLPAQSVLVSALQITAISVPATVSRGTTDTVSVTINNPTTADVTITGVVPRFSPAGNFFLGTPVGLGLLPQTSSTVVKIPVTILAGTASGPYTVNASVTGSIGGNSVVDNDVAPFPAPVWTVQAGADLAYVDGSVSPASVSQGQTHAFSVRIQNSGQATVTLNASTTRFVFTDGDSTYTATLPGPVAIAGLMTQTVTFGAERVPFMAPGAYPADIVIAGTENSVPFADTLTTADQGDLVVVETPANLQEPPNALSPDQVSLNQSVSFTVRLTNTGDADVVLDPAATTISFETFSAQLSPAGNTVLTGGNSTTELTFVSTVVPSMVTQVYNPDLVITGTENGLPFIETGGMNDGVTVQSAPTLAITDITAVPSTITADQSPITVTMTVTNNGQAAVSFTQASIDFELGGVPKNTQFVIASPPTQFVGGTTLGGGETDQVVFEVTDNTANIMSTGLMTISGEIEVLDQNTSLPVFSNPDLSSKGSLLVESPASLQILSFRPAQTTVTAGMTKNFPVDLVVRNSGGADVQLDLSNPSTFLAVSPPAGWNIQVAPQLKGSGTDVLGGGETDTIAFTVLDSGTNPGPAGVTATVAATEINSGDDRGRAAVPVGSFDVEAAGVLNVQSVTASRVLQTNARSVPWELTVNVTNIGESDIDVDLPGGVVVTFGDATVTPAVVVPSFFSSGGTVLGQGESGSFVIDVAGTGTYPTLGAKQISVEVAGVELNSGVTRQDSDNTSVTIQGVPDLVYSGLMPDTVSKGANVQFQVDVTNATAQGATAVLDVMTTQFRFDGGAFAATLSGPYQIAGGATETLIFSSEEIPGDALEGPQADMELDLHWTENGTTDSNLITDIPETDLVVQAAPLLNIVELRPSRTAVTRGVQPPWTVVMEVTNSGQTDVDLDLSQAATKLTFTRLAGGADVSSEYTVIPPAGLESAGGTLLEGLKTDSLVFTVNTTGTTEGVIIVTGRVEGENVLTQTTVSDDTFDGGATSITVQSPAALRIVDIVPGRTTATVGQTIPYDIEMVVENTGGATAALTLTEPSTGLTYTGSSNWDETLQTQLLEGGTTLAGGQTGTVVFTVNTTGDATGTTIIDGVVRGVETNTGTAVSDSTDDAGSGQIELLTASEVSVLSVVPSRPSVTENTTTDWSLTVTIENTGESAVQFDLPAGVSVDIQDEDGVVPMAYGNVNGLEAGGTVLQGRSTGTIVIPVTFTGTFDPVGPGKVVDVFIDYTDLGNEQPGTASGSSTITVQTPPALQYIVESLDPDTASTNSLVRFRIGVQNGDANTATAVLDRAMTRIFFDSGATAYNAFLDASSIDSIPGGATDTLVFEAELLTSAPSATPYDVSTSLSWAANGQTGTTPLSITGELIVEEAPALQIIGINESQDRVTAGMTTEWTVTMTVINNGPAAVDLYLDSPRTRIKFSKPGVGDLSGYTVVQPTEIDGTGSVRLETKQQGDLVFRVTETGTTTGDITINGFVTGDDLGSEEDVIDDTFDSGAGLVTVQSAPQLDIVQIRTRRATVTAGQSTDWIAVMTVANSGGADARVFLDNRSALTFQTGSGSWTVFDPVLGPDDIIEGGSVDSLIYAVDQTGDAGTWRIDGAVSGIDINSNDPVGDTTDTSGFGSILVQTPPSLRMTATSIPATPSVPRAPEVNTGQAFGVAVSVTNDGEATANNVAFSLQNSGGSTIGTLPPPIASVPAGSTRVYTVPVTAAGAVQNDTFTARFAGAADANSGESSLVQTSRDDSTATASIVAPAVLAIPRVAPSQTTVTRGQSADWQLTVVVRNDGTAPLELAVPAAGDVAFSLAGVPSSGYAVIPPGGFESGNAGWTLAGNSADSLVYTIDDTGNDVGTVDIAVTLDYTDSNNPASGGAEQAQSSVVVQNPAGLSIVQTTSGATTPNVSGSTAIVNTGWGYEIVVTVQNSGEAVDSVSVELSSDGSSSITRTSADYISIGATAQGTFTFDVTAAGSPVDLETFTSTIDYAVSANTGERVTPGPPTDNTQLVRIQTPADLSVEYFAITAPPGAADNLVSTDQVITVTARVDNLGQATVSGPRELTLTLPANFSFDGGDTPAKTFSVGQELSWQVRTPGAPQGPDTMRVDITAFPDDDNIGTQAFASADSGLIVVTTAPRGILEDAGTAITSPAGATDGVLSTGQQFTLTAAVDATTDARDVTATLYYPDGFNPVGNLVRPLGDGTDPQPLTTDFIIFAPAGVSPSDTIKVTFKGTDRNTGVDLDSLQVSIPLEVVTRTSLSLSASVTDPPDAVDRTVSVGTPFTVQARVTNNGTAGVAAPGQLEIELPTGYNLDPSESGANRKPFTPGTPVEWLVVAAPTPSGPDDIVIRIFARPADENSGLEAEVTTGEAIISMVTEGTALRVTDVTDAQVSRPASVPAGETGIGMLAFEMEYDATDPDAANARLDTIAVTVLGANGQPLGASAVGRTLSRVAVSFDGGAPYVAASTSSNPVILSLTGGGEEIVPDGVRTAVIAMDVAGNPAVEELSVQVRGGGIVARDALSGSVLGVVDAATGQALDGRLTSDPLIILSSQFEEYVHNYPNPFRAGSEMTKITYFMDRPGSVEMKVYAISGELVYERTIPQGDPGTSEGAHELEWDGRNGQGEIIRNGIYVCVLNAGGNSATFRIAVAK